MAKFKNLTTGNVLVVKDKGTIELMQKSNNYEEIKDTKSKKSEADK